MYSNGQKQPYKGSTRVECNGIITGLQGLQSLGLSF